MESSDLKIIIVDDEPNIRDTLKEFFQQLGGFRVITAHDGIEALKLISENSFDCALIDLQMPRMNGVELLEKIHHYDNTLPVIIMTGHASLEVAIETVRFGASYFLNKPVRLAELKRVLDKVLRERHLLIDNLRLKDQLRQKEAIEDLNKQLNRKIKEQSILFNVAESVGGLLSSEDLYPQMVALASDLVGAKSSLFLYYDHDQDLLLPLATKSNGRSEALESIYIPVGTGVLGRSAFNGHPVILNSPSNPEVIAQSTVGQPVLSDSLISVPMKIRDETFGILVALDKGNPGFQEEDLFLLQFLLNKAALAVENIALYESVMQNLRDTMRSLVKAIEAKDAYTEQHSSRVTELAVKVARRIGLSEDELVSLRFSCFLHDIGKIGIADHILTKPGRLTDEEFAIMRSHPVIGERIVRNLGLLPREKEIIRSHHESYDGSGYPDGLKGAEIPLMARIITVADAFDAMTSDRPYRKALSIQTAVDELRNKAWIQFDGDVVEVFIQLLQDTGEKDFLLGLLEIDSLLLEV